MALHLVVASQQEDDEGDVGGDGVPVARHGLRDGVPRELLLGAGVGPCSGVLEGGLEKA